MLQVEWTENVYLVNMNKYLQPNLSRIRDLCRQHHVRQLWAFSSVLRKDFNDSSDVDFLYELADEGLSDREFYHAF